MVSQDRHGHYPGHWQYQDDSPWSPIDASYSQTTDPSQRSRLSPWPEEVLYGPAGGLPMQRLGPPSVCPSQISSPLSNASWPSGDMMSISSTLQCSDINQTHAEESFFDSYLMLSEDHNLLGAQAQAQDQRDGENSQLLPLIFNRQSSSFNEPRSYGRTQRSFPIMPRDSTFSDCFASPNPQVSNDMSQKFNNSFLNSWPNTPEEDAQLMSKCEAVTPTTSSDLKWENMIGYAGSIQKLDGQTTSKGNNKKKKGRRNGPLDTEVARKVAQVRNDGACGLCYVMHSPVS
jgi:hypothetical protein